MMGRMKAIPLLLLCAALASGCVVTKRVDDGGRGLGGGDYGMTVDVWRDGSLSYKGRKVSRGKLVRELREDATVEVKGRPSQRAVILEAQSGVSEDRLVELRDFLVANRIPRVVLRTARSTETDVGGIDSSQLSAGQREFNAMLWSDIEAARRQSEAPGAPGAAASQRRP
jgi:hypothetical protein